MERRTFIASLAGLIGLAAGVRPIKNEYYGDPGFTDWPKKYSIPVYGVDARIFGAKCDGVTDDTKAVQDALDYAAKTGRPIDIEGQTIRIDGGIRLPKNLTGTISHNNFIGGSWSAE